MSAFFWITQVQSKIKSVGTQTKVQKFDEAEVSRENQGSEFEFKKNSKKKKLLFFSCCIVGGVAVVACAYFIRGKYILTTLANNFSTRAFSERERERERV